MSDLPERLREVASGGWAGYGVPALLREAAEEVERLREQLAEADDLMMAAVDAARERDAERARAERAESEVERLRADYVNLARLARKVFADEGHDPQRTPRRVFEDEVAPKLKAILTKVKRR